MDPCGLVMDVRRTCFVEVMRFGVHPGQVGMVRWYVAPAGAKVFSRPTPFRSWDWWERRPPVPGPLGVDPFAPRTYTKGATIPGYQGHDACGHSTWWIDGLPSVTPPNPHRDENGVPECCTNRRFGTAAFSGVGTFSAISVPLTSVFRQKRVNRGSGNTALWVWGLETWADSLEWICLAVRRYGSEVPDPQLPPGYVMYGVSNIGDLWLFLATGAFRQDDGTQTVSIGVGVYDWSILVYEITHMVPHGVDRYIAGVGTAPEIHSGQLGETRGFPEILLTAGASLGGSLQLIQPWDPQNGVYDWFDIWSGGSSRLDIQTKINLPLAYDFDQGYWVGGTSIVSQTSVICLGNVIPVVSFSGTGTFAAVGQAEALGSGAFSGTGTFAAVGQAGTSGPSYVQCGAAAGGSSHTANVTWPVATTAGNLLVAVAYARKPTSNPTITAPAGWVQAVTRTCGAAARISIYYLENASSQSSTGNFTTNTTLGVGFISVCASEFSGCLTSGSLDQTASNTSASSVTTLDSGTTGTTSQASEIAFYGYGCTDAAESFSNPTGMDSVDCTATGLTNSPSVQCGHKVFSSTGTAHGTVDISSAASAWGGCVATFKG